MITDTPKRGSSSLAGLLEALEKIAEKYPELLDTEVREHLWEVVHHRVILADSQFPIPKKLGLFSDEANRETAAALEHHLNNLSAAFQASGLKTEQERLHSFQNSNVKTPINGYMYDDFFGSP